jgi:hypothetical protein
MIGKKEFEIVDVKKATSIVFPGFSTKLVSLERAMASAICRV